MNQISSFVTCATSSPSPKSCTSAAPPCAFTSRSRRSRSRFASLKRSSAIPSSPAPPAPCASPPPAKSSSIAPGALCEPSRRPRRSPQRRPRRDRLAARRLHRLRHVDAAAGDARPLSPQTSQGRPATARSPCLRRLCSRCSTAPSMSDFSAMEARSPGSNRRRSFLNPSSPSCRPITRSPSAKPSPQPRCATSHLSSSRRPPARWPTEKTVSLCEEHGFRPRFVQEAPQWLTVMRLVGAGLGVSHRSRLRRKDRRTRRGLRPAASHAQRSQRYRARVARRRRPRDRHHLSRTGA
jgi:hypothetical protein